MKHIIPFLLFLAACTATPAPQFFGAERHDITVEGVRFVVFVKEDAAEVVRMGYLARRDRGHAITLMPQAAERASGCQVRGALTGVGKSPSLPGDSGEARFKLKCPP
ncbi:hypothetical protein [Albirhodobacter sp. R86504]|jgi:hypothetical protein|uniref:hypothetical protein n=1 Tax=Albirhodobacter sp. R86504 TaxID=3093848 RepID=UPI00366F6296